MISLVKVLNEQLEKLTRENILKYFGDINNPTFKTDYAILKAMLRIYMFQTEEEKTRETTQDYNSVGFSGVHGHILTSIANQLITFGNLSQKQLAVVRKIMIKYARQIARHINSGSISNNPTEPENIRIKKILNVWAQKNMHKY